MVDPHNFRRTTPYMTIKSNSKCMEQTGEARRKDRETEQVGPKVLPFQ